MTKKKEENIQNELPWTFQDTCSKIDDIARKLAKEINKYEPLDLLRRAYWINATHQIQGLDKDYSEHDHYISAQILEFTQNYLVSLEPVSDKRQPLEDKGWRKIEKLVRDFNDNMVLFFILRSRDLQENSEKYNFDSEELRTLDLMHWWSIRGNRYHVHHITQVQELLLPQKELFEKVFNILLRNF